MQVKGEINLWINPVTGAQESCNQHFLQALPSVPQIPRKPFLVLQKHSIPQEGSRSPQSSPRPTPATVAREGQAWVQPSGQPHALKGKIDVLITEEYLTRQVLYPSHCSGHTACDEQRGFAGKHETLLRNLDARGMVYGSFTST